MTVPPGAMTVKFRSDLGAVLDAITTYMSHAAPRGELDRLLDGERILFCCQSRLMATLWVRSERGRYSGTSLMPDRLVGSCTTLDEALRICRERSPSLMVATQLLEEGSGLDLVLEAKRLQPELRTILFLQHQHRTLLEQAVKTHSDGIVLESEMGSGHVMAALRTVSKGGIYLEPKIARQLHGSERRRNPGLSARELEVMQEVANGHNDREIGDILHIAIDTVRYHLKQVYQKLNVHSRTRAAISLVLMGLVAPPRPLLPETPDPGR
ncbi:MAG: LuxR C-terminal-related transcriptional regulator [Cyanobacteriota bacterium]